MTPDDVADIRADIWAEPWKDRQLFPDLLHKVVTELTVVATGGVLEIGWDGGAPQLAIDCENSPIQEWASSLLRTMQNRARSGVPFDEPPYEDQPPTNPEDL